MNKKSKKINGQRGFSLIEVLIALTILLIALLGVFYTFTYAVNYNFGNSLRIQAIEIIQKELETLQCAKFSANGIDQSLLGGEKTPKLVTTADGNNFLVQIIIDDDPFVNGIQIDNSKTLKEITITIKGESSSASWQTAVPSQIIFRRVRGY